MIYFIPHGEHLLVCQLLHFLFTLDKESIYISHEPSLKKVGGDLHCSKFNKFNKIDQKRDRVHWRAQNFKEKAIRCEIKNP